MASVLIIDDEVGIREWLSEILEDEGYRVATAANGEEGRAKLASFAPDVVLLDIWMPDIDGVSLLKAWIAQYGRQLPPVVMISGHATIETAVEATKLGAFGLLEKPIATQKLLEVVKRAVEQGRADRAPEAGEAWWKGLPALLQPPVAQLVAHLRQHRTALLRFPDPFFKEWLLRHLTAAAPCVWLAHDGQPLTVDQVRQWQGKRLLVTLGEPVQKMVAKNLGFLYQHAPAYQIELVAVAHGAEGGASWFPYIGERLAKGWQPAVEVPPRAAVEDAVPELLASALTCELGHPVVWSSAEITTIERLTVDHPGPFEAWVQALLPAAEAGQLDRAAIEAALCGRAAEERDLYTLFAMPLREAREAFERLYLERLLARNDLPVQRLAELAGLERTHFYRKLRQLGLSLRRRDEEEAP